MLAFDSELGDQVPPHLRLSPSEEGERKEESA